MATLAAHPHPEDGFAGIEVRGDTLTDKENAGAALWMPVRRSKTPSRYRSAVTGALLCQ